MRINVQAISILLFLCFVSSCTIQPPKQDHNPRRFSQDLRGFAAKNKHRAMKKDRSEKTPDDVLSGLVPSPASDGIAHRSPERFDIQVNNASARAFFKGLVKDTGKSILISPNVKGNITLDLKNVTIPQVLEAVRETYGFEYKATNYGYKIEPAQLETQAFHVNYLNVKRNSISETSINSGQLTQKIGAGSDEDDSGGSTTSSAQQSNNQAPNRIETDSKTDFWQSLETTLKSMVDTENGRRVTLNPQAGLVVVKAYPNELREIKDYLDTIQNTLNREVIIEARVVEVRLSAKLAAGIDWKFPRFKKQLVNNLIDTAQNSATFSNPFQLTISSDNSLRSIINLLGEQGDINVLSSPRVATSNNQPAVIKVGSDEFFVTDVESNQVTGQTGAVNNTQDIQLTPFFSGIALDVTPHIDSHKRVTLHVHPVISDVQDQQKQFTVSGRQQNLPLALSSIRESDSIISADSGEIIVIGGLMKNKSNNKHGTVPLMSRVPILGKLFNNEQKESEKTELVIILRPIIVNRENNNQQLQDTARRFERMRKPYQYKWDLPWPSDKILNKKG